MTKKSILITGAGSGFGKSAAIGMARNGHDIIVTCHVSSQVMPLREEVASLGLTDRIRVERLDLDDPYDIKQAVGWDIDVLWNNAGMGEAGPVWEIPLDLVRRNYEVNVFGRKRFGDAGYAMEELVAELGAAFVCADLELTPQPREEHAAYIASWLKVLKGENRAIFSAAAHAQRAADYLNGLQPKAQEERAAA